MVDANTPWSLKGISDEARNIAKNAANEANLPVGGWLSNVIHAAADFETREPYTGPSTAAPHQLDAAPALSAAPEPADIPVDQNANTIERAVQVVSDFGFEPEGPARDIDLLQDRQILEDKLRVLEARLAQSTNQQSDVVVSLHSEIARVRRQLENLG